MQTKNTLLTYIAAREQELAGYQTNIDNYTAMLRVMPSAWPQGLDQYRNMPPAELVSELCFADLKTVSDLQFSDRISKTLAVEKLEASKVEFMLAGLKLQLSETENVA